MKGETPPGVVIIEGHVQGLSNTRSLGEANVPVYVVDKTNCIARYSRYCKKFFICPDFSSDEFVNFLLDLGRREDLIGWLLLPSNDHALYSISKRKRDLENIFKVITPDESIIIQIYNKQNLLSNASLVGTPIPVSWFPVEENESLPENLNFPVLVKGKFGLSFFKQTGKKAYLIKDSKELIQFMKNLYLKLSPSELFIQELIPLTGYNKTVSYCAFCIEGEVKSFWIGKKLREHPVEFGTATFAESIMVEEVIEPANNLLRYLKYTGPCEIEFLWDKRDNTYKLIEVNARTWLWVELARKCGVDFALMSYYYKNNIEQSFPTSYKYELVWSNIYTDIAFSLREILCLRLNFIDFFKSYRRNTILAGFNKRDIKPFIAYPLMAFNFLRTR